MAVSLPSGFGSTAQAYLNNFPGDPRLETFNAIKSTASADAAREMTRLNFTKGMDMATDMLEVKGDLVERDMINDQLQWELEKRQKFTKQQNVMSNLANIWGGDSLNLRMAGDNLKGATSTGGVTPQISAIEIPSSSGGQLDTTALINALGEGLGLGG
tara:strand:- start:59 stop:532 length:474 start_codon:yes stop_codon:yes gene_type:complete